MRHPIMRHPITMGVSDRLWAGIALAACLLLFCAITATVEADAEVGGSCGGVRAESVGFDGGGEGSDSSSAGGESSCGCGKALSRPDTSGNVHEAASAAAKYTTPLPHESFGESPEEAA